MATAQREGGLYYVNGKAVDAEGKAIEGAPKQQPDTDPSQQPGGLVAVGVVSADPIQRLADTITAALGGAKAVKVKSASEDEGASDELPTLDELEAHIADMDAKQVKALQKKDERKGAVAIYEARLDALKGE